MANPEKAAAVAELVDQFRSSSAAVLTEYRGLSVGQLQTLRRSVRENANYAVVKNTLTEIAAKEAGVDAFEGKMSGPSAIAFVHGDPVDVAKALRDFAKNNPQLIVKGGYMDGAALDEEGMKKLADLESREVLLGKLAGAFIGAQSKAASTFQAPISKIARAVDALRAKQEEAA
ncbi:MULTISPECIES: 50S ribosomal protein L10 [Nesterenkonia]|uniref:Large ribosomal subunit protein uL10 n=1 Tax=Nesterenkonia xinjiangensis TaxID=225327 RepID=A0A7Z0K897_9MICC|nr:MULTISPECIES: 50S ribosomal protein L10 [Nesterenkonia]MDZ5076517.1 50S ribosomal protein L10 [Nesterenkonia sp. HG001]NYJ77421.1 large subunit ribosomal protein L10 [Nesterenkonia xinjiangensis]